jgi:signaling intermediate in Toll pathway protein
MFWWYPQHQECAIQLLDFMEWHGVIPDKELFNIMCDRFGKWNFCVKKVNRQLYWLPKLKHTNKWVCLEEKEMDGIETNLKMLILQKNFLSFHSDIWTGV